jgi:hypothetical protein
VQGGIVSGASDFDLAVAADAAADQRGVLSRDGALAEEPIGHFEKLIELEADARKAAEHRVKVGHE